MTGDFDMTLDSALSRLQQQDSIAKILSNYPAEAEALSPLLQAAAALNTLQKVEIPAAVDLMADREQFFAELAALPITATPSVKSFSLWRRFCTRLSPPHVNKKEKNTMTAILARAILALTLLVGGIGGTAVLADNSLPDSPLYNVKLGLEQIRLDLATSDISRAETHLELAQVRIQEMEELAENGRIPDTASLTRLQTHLQTALQIAATLPDMQMQQLLQQTQQMVQAGTANLFQAQVRTQAATQEPLGAAHQLLQQIGQEIETGLQDPQTFRWRYAHEKPEGAPTPPDMEPNPGGVITHTNPITIGQPITIPLRAGPGDGTHGDVISHTQPITPNHPITTPVQAGQPITTPVQAGSGYGPGEPGGNPVGPVNDGQQQNGQDDPGAGPGPGPNAGEPTPESQTDNPAQPDPPAAPGCTQPDCAPPGDHGGHGSHGG